MMQKQRDYDAITAGAMDNAYPNWRKDKKAYGDKWDTMRDKIKEGYKK